MMYYGVEDSTSVGLVFVLVSHIINITPNNVFITLTIPVTSINSLDIIFWADFSTLPEGGSLGYLYLLFSVTENKRNKNIFPYFVPIPYSGGPLVVITPVWPELLHFS